jgi:flagellar hook-length control protein FliK
VAAPPALTLRSTLPTPAAERAAAAAGHETGHATSAAPSGEAETRDLPGARGVAAQDASAQDAPAHDHGGDRGHAPPNEPGSRAASSDTLLQRPGVAAPPAFAALITAADGTLRLGAPLPTAAAGAAADEQIANLQRMVQTMRVMVRETVSQATVRLRPEHLGEVTIDVRVDGKSVSAVIHSESANVREWMQGQESSLRNGLSEHGLHLEKLQVQRDGRQDGREGQQQPERRKARARQHDNAQGTFEITV